MFIENSCILQRLYRIHSRKRLKTLTQVSKLIHLKLKFRSRIRGSEHVSKELNYVFFFLRRIQRKHTANITGIRLFPDSKRSVVGSLRFLLCVLFLPYVWIFLCKFFVLLLFLCFCCAVFVVCLLLSFIQLFVWILMYSDRFRKSTHF